MQRAFLVAVGVVGFAGLGAARVAIDGSSLQEQDAVVDVDVRCRGNAEPTWDVEPDTVTIRLGQGVAWRLNANGHGNTVEVTPKADQRPWPFANGRHTGNRQNPARSGASRATGRWGYNITVVCQEGNNDPRTVVIDPDVIITPGG